MKEKCDNCGKDADYTCCDCGVSYCYECEESYSCEECCASVCPDCFDPECGYYFCSECTRIEDHV